MRKNIINEVDKEQTSTETAWLDIEKMASVEMTSETPDHPIENAFSPDNNSYWCAGQAGRQVIRLIFDEPQNLKRILVEFREKHSCRTQEFVLRWQEKGATEMRELLRQQYNFNPSTASCEKEELDVQLTNAMMVELEIIPDISGGNLCASLSQFFLA